MLSQKKKKRKREEKNLPTVAYHGSLKRDVFQKYDTVQSNDGVF
jgi:hypothetical protein